MISHEMMSKKSQLGGHVFALPKSTYLAFIYSNKNYELFSF